MTPMAAAAAPAAAATTTHRSLTGLFSPISFRSVLDHLARIGNSQRKPGADRPRISAHSKHYEYAMLVYAGGVPNEDACAEVGVSPRTAERWRHELRDQAKLYFGREVTYEYAARYALDEEWRRIVDASLRSPGH